MAKVVDYQLVPQIMTASADDFVRVADPLLSVASRVDLNAGCPSPNAVRGCAGSSLLKPPEALQSFLAKIVARTEAGRISVKIRAGWESSQECSTILAHLAELPLHSVCLHARTRLQGYRGEADWSLFPQSYPLPLVGSGDITNWRILRTRQLAANAVSSFLAGRGVLRNPWIFEEFRRNHRVKLSIKTLLTSLRCYVLLVGSFLADRSQFVVRVADLPWLQPPCLHHDERWHRWHQQLSCALPYDLAEPRLHRLVLGRLKMIWAALRLSLPFPLQTSALMRCSDVESLLQGIADRAAENGIHRLPIGSHSES